MTISEEVRATIRRLYHAEHYSVHGIYKATGVHHATIKRIIRIEKHGERIVAGRRSKLDAFDDLIRKHLELYHKISATRLMQILVDHGYKGGLSLLRQRLRRLRPTMTKPYMRMVVHAGEQGQVDWAHCGELRVGRGTRKLYLFVAVLSYSRVVYARFCLNQNTATFLRCHEQAFAYFGGIPRVILYDNLKSVVLARLGQSIRFNDDMLSFSGFYCFEPRPCQPYRGNEKGRVERTIRYLRENFLMARPLTNLATMNASLLEWCNRIGNRRPWPDDRRFRVEQMWAKEKPNLLPLSEHRQHPREQQTCQAGKSPWIHFDLNYYSIPPEYVGRSLLVYADDQQLEVTYDGKSIGSHQRCWDRGIYVDDPAHRDALIKYKHFGRANMFRDSIIREFPEAGRIIEVLFEQGWDIQAVTRRLHKMRYNFGPQIFLAALKAVLQRQHVSLEAIQLEAQKLQRQSQLPPTIPVQLPDNPKVRELEVKSHALKNYDKL